MGPVSFTYSASVPAAIDNVFALISDPVRMPEWLPRCVAVQATTNHKFPGKGARYKLTFQRESHRHEAVIEIIDFQAPHTFGWVEIITGRDQKPFSRWGSRAARRKSHSSTFGCRRGSGPGSTASFTAAATHTGCSMA